MKSTHSERRLRARRMRSALIMCVGLLTLATISTHSQPPIPGVPPAPEQHEFWLFPQLTQTPNGECNRLHGELRTRFERLRTLSMQIDEQSQALQDLQRQGRGPHMGTRPLVNLRDQLAALHGSVDTLVQEAEGTREFLRTEVVPQLPTMIEEVNREIESLPAEDLNRHRLEFLRIALERFAENPDAVMARFEHGAQIGDWPGGPPDFEHQPEGGPQGSWRLSRRLERIEAQQQSLREQLDANDREIQRIRGWLERTGSDNAQDPSQQPHGRPEMRGLSPESQPMAPPSPPPPVRR